MKNNYINPLKISLLALIFAFSSAIEAQTTARYTVTFTSVWNAADHGTLPNNAHWSRLVGATHNNSTSFWDLGQLATPGIEDVAEKGENAIFQGEVNSEITNGNADQYINGSNLNTATGNIVISNLDVSEDFPYLTLVSMIAPSPDWMVGISSVNLRAGGNWAASLSFDLYPIDAGTDSGTSYTAGNADTNPQDPISILQNMYGFNDQKIGTMTLTLNEVLSVEDPSIASYKIYPNPTTDVLNISASQGNLPNQLRIYNTLGQLVFQKAVVSERDLSIQTQGFHKGLYILELQNSHKTTSMRFVKR